MKRRRTSSVLAWAAQCSFGIALAFLPWKTSALLAFAISLAALAIRLFPRTGKSALKPEGASSCAQAFPRLELGSFFVFSFMCVSALVMESGLLFPLTGLFFASGLACSCLAETAYKLIDGRNPKPSLAPATILGCAYGLSAILQLTLFPRPGYLYWGVGLLILASIADLAFAAMLSRKPRKREARSAVCLAIFVAFATAAPMAVSEAPANDDELFSRLFDEELPEESPSDILNVAEIAVQRPECFTDAYVLSFARGLKRGQRLTRAELERTLARIAARLESSGKFYQSSAAYRTADNGEASDVKVQISVSEGFWWGFNFSPWDVSVGYGNLFRQGKSLGAIAGLNTQAIEYSDPSVMGSPARFSLGASHGASLSGGGIDPEFIYERQSVSGLFGYGVADDLSIDFRVVCLGARTIQDYFLYPGFQAPSAAELAALGLGSSTRTVLSSRITASVGDFSYESRGGLKGRAEAGAGAVLPVGAAQPGYYFTFDGDLRYDAPTLLRAVLHGALEYFPRALTGSGVPEPLWAAASELRGPTRLPSGEFAVLSRLSLSLDSVARLNLGFTTMSLVPELFYEAAASRRAGISPGLNLVQDCGALLKAEFSSPVGRTFGLGCSLALPIEETPLLKFVFEVE